MLVCSVTKPNACFVSQRSKPNPSPILSDLPFETGSVSPKSAFNSFQRQDTKSQLSEYGLGPCVGTPRIWTFPTRRTVLLLTAHSFLQILVYLRMELMKNGCKENIA